tara:strand:+ start:194 stop:430 length:237 start_codon:yes stop_codon:yes gene_type:complete
MFESKKFKQNNSESNSNKLHHNIKIIIDEPKISPYNSNTSLKTNVSTPSSPSYMESMTSMTSMSPSKDEYDLYTWDIL